MTSDKVLSELALWLQERLTAYSGWARPDELTFGRMKQIQDVLDFLEGVGPVDPITPPSPQSETVQLAEDAYLNAKAAEEFLKGAAPTPPETPHPEKSESDYETSRSAPPEGAREKCGNQGCAEFATFRVEWPGQPSVMCERHKRQAEGIAEAMGFALSARRFSAPTKEVGDG